MTKSEQDQFRWASKGIITEALTDFGITDKMGRKIGYRVIVLKNMSNDTSPFEAVTTVTRDGVKYGSTPTPIIGDTVEAVEKIAIKRLSEARTRSEKAAA